MKTFNEKGSKKFLAMVPNGTTQGWGCPKGFYVCIE
jgi:hypothetical protein